MLTIAIGKTLLHQEIISFTKAGDLLYEVAAILLSFVKELTDLSPFLFVWFFLSKQLFREKTQHSKALGIYRAEVRQKHLNREMLFQAGGFSFCSKWMSMKTAQTTPK